MERAVTSCDGWYPLEQPPARALYTRTAPISGVPGLRRRLGELRILIDQHGRERSLDVCFLRKTGWLTLRPTEMLEEIALLEDIGVTWIGTGFESRSMADFIEKVYTFAEVVRPSSTLISAPPI